MDDADFSLQALYEALDAERRVRGLSWAAAAREISGLETKGRAIASSTITSLATKRVAEGDGVLSMLVWLGRTPESFCAGVRGASSKRFRLEPPDRDHILRWDAKALHAALNEQRQVRGLTWSELATEIGGDCTAATLTRLAKGGRVALPGVMRMVRWLKRPAAEFTRHAARRGGPRK